MSKDIKYCPKCGEQVPHDYKFCHSCGFDFSELERIEKVVREEEPLEQEIVEEIAQNEIEQEAIEQEVPVHVESVQEERVEPVSQEPVPEERPVEKGKSGNGKKMGLLVGLVALVLVGVYFFMNREPGLAGTYYSQAVSSETPSVVEISEEERMSYTFETFVDGMPYSLTMHFNLEPLGEESFVITETDGFYMDAVYEGTEDEVDVFIDKFTDTYSSSWEELFEITYNGSQSKASFSPRRMSAEEIKEYELWNFEAFTVMVRDGNLIVEDQLFVRAEEG